MSATLALLSLLRIRAKNWGSPPGEPQFLFFNSKAPTSRAARRARLNQCGRRPRRVATV